MTLKKDANGNYVLTPNRMGFEAVPFGGAVAVDLTADGNSIGLDAPLEFGAGSCLVVAGYAATLEALALVPAHRAGLVTKGEIARAATGAAWSEVKSKSAYLIACACVVAVLPGTIPFFGFASFIGGSVMAYKIVRAFGAALSDEQLSNIKAAAGKAGVDIPGVTDRSSKAAPDVWSDDVEPLPTFA